MCDLHVHSLSREVQHLRVATPAAHWTPHSALCSTLLACHDMAARKYSITKSLVAYCADPPLGHCMLLCHLLLCFNKRDIVHHCPSQLFLRFLRLQGAVTSKVLGWCLVTTAQPWHANLKCKALVLSERSPRSSAMPGISAALPILRLWLPIENSPWFLPVKFHVLLYHENAKILN